jgi:TolA-binding protein
VTHVDGVDCRNELVARERSGELSSAERVALDAHLVRCGTCRLSRKLGRDFDADATLESGDGARIAALSVAAERWAEGRERAPLVPLKRRRVRAALLAVAAAFAAMGASAGAGTWSSLFRANEPAAAVSAAVPKPTQQRIAVPTASPAITAEPKPLEPTTPKAEARVRAGSDSAASLFKEASSARRAGNAERAIALYRRLEHEFPASAEAGLAALPLGGLLLERGEARAALSQFDRHAKAGGGSRLLPEALYGRGRSLAALGNRSEERRTWERLLGEFPESPYAGHAKRRLVELESKR